VPRPPFPKSLIEFQGRFLDEAACHRYLAESRWPDGFVCPACHGTKGWEIRRRVPCRAVTPDPEPRTRILWECATCGHQTSLTAGTVMQNTKLPLTVWFWAAFLVATDRRGLSALLLKRQLALGNINSAWFLLHKLRRAMVNAQRTKLSGRVEMDGTYIGGWQPGLKGGRQRKGRKAAMVLVAVEVRTMTRKRRNGTQETKEVAGRVRMEVARAENADSITQFLKENVEPGSAVRTDGLNDYPGAVGAAGCIHERKVQGRIGSGGQQVVVLAHGTIGNLKNWLNGTHHGVGRPHLQAYLDEFVFRFNRRQSPEAAFQTLLGLGSDHAHVPCNVIRGATDLPYFYEGEETQEAARDSATTG
jgi:transposase-like protein